MIGSAHASTTATFDTAADMNALFNLDVYKGDILTEHHLGSEQNAIDGGFVHFNDWSTTNSVQLKDTNNQIESFTFWEWDYEYSTGNSWTWSFFDEVGGLVGTNNYTNTGDSTPQTLDLLSLGFAGVAGVQLGHHDGWMNIDNLVYDAKVSAVPVPAALLMFGPALLGFFGFRRKFQA